MLLRTIHIIAIVGAIAFLAWTKAHHVTAVIPYFPHRRTVTAVCSRW
jgi:hypothetical protein